MSVAPTAAKVLHHFFSDLAYGFVDLLDVGFGQTQLFGRQFAGDGELPRS